jgi:hypothetical protein
VDAVSVEELLPPNRIVENMLLIGQEEMPDCRGIKDMGFNPISYIIVKPQPQRKFLTKENTRETHKLILQGL